MTSSGTPAQATGQTQHRVFAAFYRRVTSGPGERGTTGPLRVELVGQAHGIVLEVGAGTGLNFPYYDPTRVEKVEATEPDMYMERYAREAAASAHVPVALSSSSVESLPFLDETFDTVLATLVFCSVADPNRGLREVYRVLKPGGMFLLAEHVRSENSLIAGVQNMITPFSVRLAANCHWNRDTVSAVQEAGFQIEWQRQAMGGFQPIVLVRATRPA